MAKGINHIVLVGALARDPELRYTPSGMAVFDFTVAGQEELVGQDGVSRTVPWYHRVSSLGKAAEYHADRQMKAGQPVFIEGALDYRQWEDEQGAKRSMVSIKALRIQPIATTPELVHDAGGSVRMCGALNEVLVLGNLTRDPELRYLQTGDAWLKMALAVNDSYQDRNGTWQEKVHYIDVTLWRGLAEEMKELRKGDPIVVRGRLTNESWTDKEGNKRSTTKIEATRVESLLRGAPTGQSGDAPSSVAYTQAPNVTTPHMGRNHSEGLDIDPPEGGFVSAEDSPF